VQLVDCFISLIAYVRHFQLSPHGNSSTFNTQIDRLIDAARNDALAAGFSDSDVENALFAVTAWIDEVVLLSEWEGATDWQRQLLQKRYFSVTNAGNSFFTRLDELAVEQLSVREIYYFCLAMGFVGRYGYDRNQTALAKLKNDNLLILLKNRDNLSGAAKDLLFPDGYPDHPKRSAPVITSSSWRWQFSSLTKAALLIPALVLLTLFGIYYLIIWQLADSILKQIP
jgi:type VI secretion system protein ImpK